MMPMDYQTVMAEMIDEARFSKELGARLAKARKEAGLSQAQLAELVGQCQQSIADYETGRRRIQACKLAMIADVLGIESSEFLLNAPNTPRKRGPQSRLQQQFEQIKRLPRTEQVFVVRMLDNALANAH